MFRKIFGSPKNHKELIKWRGHEVTRIEAFSDAVFAFAVTLMVVSLEVPKTFTELLESLKGFIPFSVCFALFFQIWATQNLYFRRFGLHDDWTLTLNAILLLLVLFFVYPMKFLWSALFHFQTAFTDDSQAATLFMIYSAGFAAIYILYGLMYVHAHNMRSKLKLTDSEAFETITYVYRCFAMASVGVASLVIASFGPNSLPFAGAVYGLIGLAIGRTHAVRGKTHRKRFGELKEATEEPHEETVVRS